VYHNQILISLVIEMYSFIDSQKLLMLTALNLQDYFQWWFHVQ